MLAGEMEVELLESEGLAAKTEGAALCDDLDGGAQVLELGACCEIGDIDGELACGNHVERTNGHVDGRLLPPRQACSVCCVQ